MQKISFGRHRFPSEIIVHAVWLYARFTLSFRDVEDLLAERGLDVSYETVRRWFLKFGDGVARNLRVHRPAPSGHWYSFAENGTGYGELSTMKERFWTFWFNPGGTRKPQQS